MQSQNLSEMLETGYKEPVVAKTTAQKVEEAKKYSKEYHDFAKTLSDHAHKASKMANDGLFPTSEKGHKYAMDAHEAAADVHDELGNVDHVATHVNAADQHRASLPGAVE